MALVDIHAVDEGTGLEDVGQEEVEVAAVMKH